jgi:hypothetical protein
MPVMKIHQFGSDTDGGFDICCGAGSPGTDCSHREACPHRQHPSNSGKEMFNSYCAVCRGKDGKSGGPAASALKTPPAAPTQLAKNNGGKYPSSHVAAVTKGQATTPSHGSQEMPVRRRLSPPCGWRRPSPRCGWERRVCIQTRNPSTFGSSS